ncbi:hypothetical protein GCM10010439_08420 [Actinocorallia aurantiaca]|uniref:Uncharacterized protein n=1 Tax=Actinocorallia aurantiaca TaxID=46204 RepID=A0ABP6GAY3_9ACTN
MDSVIGASGTLIDLATSLRDKAPRSLAVLSKAYAFRAVTGPVPDGNQGRTISTVG